MRNVVIIGAGIAGLTAAIYTARAELKPLVISGPQEGGQLTLTTEVENYPGFENGIDGNELVNQSKKQAQRFGAEFQTGSVESITKSDNIFTIKLANKEIQTRTVIIATGASARWLGLESEKQYQGKGVTACATCDGFFFKDKKVIVVGGGDTAMEEALFLTKFCTKVTVIHRRDELRASQIMQKRFFDHEKTDIIWNAVVEEILGDGTVVTGVKLRDTKTGNVTEFKTDGVFLAIGHIPNTGFVKGFIDMDEKGYITADRFTKTNVAGLFACGDVQDTKYRQAITAAGSGCQSAIEVEHYLNNNF